MYRPKHFTVNDKEILLNFIEENPLGLLVTDDFEANLIPMTISIESEELYLSCHIAKSNTQIKSLENNPEVLIVFKGADAYITPNVYETKKRHGKAVPTWNYTMVQARASAAIVEDKRWIKDQIEYLTNKMENREEIPWKVSDAPNDYIDKLLNVVVGIKIKVNKLEGVFKASQNQPRENQIAVKNYLVEKNNLSMANEVLKSEN